MAFARRAGFLLVAGLAAGFAPGALVGQGLTVTSNSSLKASGALGMVARMAGGSNNVATTFISGHRMRTDSRDQSTIIDLDAGRFTTLDHKKKTYSTVTLEELAAAMNNAQAQAQAKAEQTQKAPRDEKPSDIEWSYDVKADRTGEHQRIAGYEAQRNFITVTVTAREKGKAAGPNDGALVAFVDMWNSTDAPNAAAMAEFQRAYAQRMKTEFRSQTKALEAAFGSDPRMKTAAQASAREMAKIKGISLRSTTSFIAVPEGKSFDRQLALGAASQQQAEAAAEEAKPKPKGGFFGKLKAVAEQAEQQGKSRDSSAPATQATIISFTSEVQDIKSGVPSDVFSVPAGYREVKRDVPGSR